MKRHNAFVYKNTSLFFISSQKVKIGCKYEREAETKDLDTGWRRTVILTFFLNHIVNSVFSALHLFFLDGRFSTGGLPGTTLPTPGHSPATDWLFSPWIPVYIWFHYAYAFPVRLPAVNPCDLLPLFSCLHS